MQYPLSLRFLFLIQIDPIENRNFMKFPKEIVKKLKGCEEESIPQIVEYYFQMEMTSPSFYFDGIFLLFRIFSYNPSYGYPRWATRRLYHSRKDQK